MKSPQREKRNPPQVTITLYYEQMKTEEDIRRNPQNDHRRYACFLSCARTDGSFDQLFQFCSSLKPNTSLGGAKDQHSVQFLPTGLGKITFGCNTFPVIFSSMLVKPLERQVHLYFKTTFNLLSSGGALWNFLQLVLCATEGSWKKGEKPLFVLQHQKGLEKDWRHVRELGWRYCHCGSSNFAQLIGEIICKIEAISREAS